GATPLWEDETQLAELNRLATIIDTDKRSEFWAFTIESKTTLAAFIKKKTTHFKIVSDASEIQKVLNIPGFPTYIVIDSDGIERFRQVGNSYQITEKLVSIAKQLNSEFFGKQTRSLERYEIKN
ncbi:hypothetical protein KAH55_10705, partial [bacterium]|nr:hypothetical protein [bacterium]